MLGEPITLVPSVLLSLLPIISSVSSLTYSGLFWSWSLGWSWCIWFVESVASFLGVLLLNSPTLDSEVALTFLSLPNSSYIKFSLYIFEYTARFLNYKSMLIKLKLWFSVKKKQFWHHYDFIAKDRSLRL